MIQELERGNDQKTQEEKEMRDLELRKGGPAFDKRAGRVSGHSESVLTSQRS